MDAQTDGDRPSGGTLKAQISNAVVAVTREFTGRGPTRARTTIRENLVVVLLEDTLTRGERVLVEKDRGERVLDFRREFQQAMREELSGHVERLTGRTVTAMMSANHLDPDLAVEIFVLDGDVVERPFAAEPEAAATAS